MSFEEPRTYRSDDRDLRGDDNDLGVFAGGNGDWYITIVAHGERLGPAVRLTTSGTPRGLDHVPAAVANLYRALGAERPARGNEDAAFEAGRLSEREDLLAFLERELSTGASWAAIRECIEEAEIHVSDENRCGFPGSGEHAAWCRCGVEP